MDWKGKQAEVFATADGFDPAALPEAVKKAGFTTPDAGVSLVVTAVGSVDSQGDSLFLVLPGVRWKLSGEKVADLAGSASDERARVTGAFAAATEGGNAVLRVTSFELSSDSDPN